MGTERKKRKISIIKNKSKPKPADSKSNKQEDSNNGHKSGLELVNGSRKRRKIIRIASLSVALAVVLALIIVNILAPTGLVEYLQNSYAASGSGDFPVSVYSSNALNFSCRDDIVTVLNDTFFEVYNTDGKLIQAVSHGMSNPVCEESEARFLLYDRERYAVSIYNYSNELFSFEFEKSIISADIGRDGSYAVVTASDSYKNSVQVFNRSNELQYTWNSANYYITDVAVADNGESIAVSLLNSNAGSFESFVYILEFESATPKHTYMFDDVVSAVANCGEYILANGFDRAFSIKWEGGETDLGVNGNVRCYDFDYDENSVLVYGRGDNEQVNTVLILGEGGGAKTNFQFNAAVTDVAVTESGIAVLSSTACYIYDLKGNLKSELISEYKGLFVGLSSDGKAMILDNSKLFTLN